MTAPSLGRLLISHITLRGPDMAQLYELIDARPGIGYEDIADALIPGGLGQSEFGLEEAPLREALNFLLVARMVEQQGPSRRRASFRATPLREGQPFALLLLHHLQGHPDQRQRAPSLVYRQLVVDDTLSITPSALREQMERGPYRDLFTWTTEKISFWGHLIAFTGLIYRSEREADWTIAPAPSVALAALRWGAAVSGRTSLDAALAVIDAELFACFTSRGRVHSGFAQSLLALDQIGVVRLTHSADAAQSVTLGERRVSDIWFPKM